MSRRGFDFDSLLNVFLEGNHTGLMVCNVWHGFEKCFRERERTLVVSFLCGYGCRFIFSWQCVALQAA